MLIASALGARVLAGDVMTSLLLWRHVAAPLHYESLLY